MSAIRRHLTYANVMSTLAAFVAVAGSTAYAADHLGHESVGAAQLRKNSVTGPKVRNGTLTGADLDVATLPTIPRAAAARGADTAKSADNATHADSATRADTAGSADHATGADRAANADHATFADTASSAGTASIAAALMPPEPPHVVGAPGEPSFDAAYSFTEVGAPRFYEDREGFVHLEGNLTATADGTGGMFQLPTAYRPARDEAFWGVSPNAAADLTVNTNGVVTANGIPKGQPVSLDGISWRAGS